MEIMRGRKKNRTKQKKEHDHLKSPILLKSSIFEQDANKFLFAVNT